MMERFAPNSARPDTNTRTMTKRERDEYQQRRELNAAGWDVRKRDSVAFNSGSESPEHITCKALVSWYLKQQGYRVSTEVENQDGTAEADIVAYGRDEPAFIVECETGITDAIREKKLSQFFHNEPYCEAYLLEVENMPDSIDEIIDWIQAELGGSIDR